MKQLEPTNLVRSTTYEHINQHSSINSCLSYDTEHYYALHTFLEDDELHNVWNIVEKAMNRHGHDVSNSELSMRLYDQELKENIEHDMENLLWIY